MKINIIKGTNQIGGCITEISTKTTKIIIDYGKNLDDTPQIDVKGLTFGKAKYDAVIISHYHMDHIGVINNILDIPIYVEKTTSIIYKIINDFSNEKTRKLNLFKFNKSFDIGDLKITPYKVDHSAYNSAMFLLEDKTTKEKVLYTGDYRDNGYYGSKLIPTIKKIGKVDYLITEGTNINSSSHILKKEENLVNEFVEIFKKYDKVFVLMSASNIDRITTLLKAANKTKHTLIQDIYLAHLTSVIYKNDKVNIPNPISFDDIMVYKPKYFEYKSDKFKKKYLYTFDDKNNNNILYKPFVMNIRTSMLKDLEIFKYVDNKNSKKILDNACIIYSMWDGYKEKEDIKTFLENSKKLDIDIIEKDIHTSGHASEDLINEIKILTNPKKTYIIHTNSKGEK